MLRDALVALAGAALTSYAEYKFKYNLYDLVTDKIKAAVKVVADGEKVKAVLSSL